MKKAAGLYLFLVSLLLPVIGFWFYNQTNMPMGNALTGDAAGRLLAYGRLAGLLAVFGILLQITLVGRVRWVERIFGLDRLTRLHHVVGFSLVVFILSHPVLVTAGHALQGGFSWGGQLLDFFKDWEDVLAAAVGLAILLAAVGFSIALVRSRLPYEAWYATHLAIYIAVALAFGHQLAVGGDFLTNRAFAFYWYALYAFTFGNLVYYRFLRPLLMVRRHRFHVAEVKAETDDVCSIVIRGRNLDSFSVEAGQFMLVRFWTPGLRWQVHPFSMSCPPDGTRLRLTIKAVGDFTRRIPSIRPGTPVIIDGPHGLFTPRRCQSRKALLIAGGIGITPIRSIADRLLGDGRDVALVYGNRNFPSIVFREELDTLAAGSSGRFRIVHVMSDQPDFPGEKGRVDRDRIARLVPDIRERDVYLCGPPPMMKKLRAGLFSLGVPENRLYDERFAL